MDSTEIAVPDREGDPSHQQWKTMVQKLLADRFQLKFHHDKRELSVYVLSLAKGASGPGSDLRFISSSHADSSVPEVPFF
jgi:uncharacterized protein (TIGR03435 family)